MNQEQKTGGLGYATDALKGSAQAATKTESMSLRRGKSKIIVNISKRREMSQSPHYHKYDLAKYDLHPGYMFPEFLQSLVPTGTPEYVDSGQRYVERMIRALYYFKQCALIGPSGTGKTHITYLVAELTGLPVWEVNCGLQTSSYDLIGRFIGLGKENWVDGQVTSWLRFGGLLYLDEANMMKQDVATRLNPVLDTRGHLVLTEKDNDIVTRHPYAYVIISMNPFSAEFSGTKPLNAAFRRRMSVWVNFDYESLGDKVSQKEIDLLRKRTNVDEDTAYKIIKVGAEMRRQYKSGDLPYGPSIGDLIHWAILIKDGSDPISAAEETIVALTSDSVEVQGDVRRLVEAIFSR
jgi:nitric oxide reductase NorQ protein